MQMTDDMSLLKVFNLHNGLPEEGRTFNMAFHQPRNFLHNLKGPEERKHIYRMSVPRNSTW